MIDQDQDFTLDENQEVENVNEESVEIAETSAAATLKPTSSKSEMLSSVMKHFAGMTKQDLSVFLDKTLAQVGHEADNVPNASASNMNSVSMNKVSVPSPTSGAVKEDVAELFAGEELSEEFVTKASTLFEAAVNNRVDLVSVELEEQYEQKLNEQVTASIEELHEQVNQYMDYVVEKWMEENSVALVNNYRAESTENFINGLKSLFAEHYVEVPEEKVDLIADLEEQVSKLEESVESAHAENVKLTNEINQSKMDAAFESVSEGLIATQVEKLRSLSESIEYASLEDYQSKLTIVKNQYFSEETENKSTGMIVEEDTIGQNDLVESENVVPVEMRNYVQAISKTVKR